MHPVFASAAICRPPRVLIWNLEQFQLGHAYLLHAIGSPYMVGGGVEKPDLALAAWICSRPASASMRLFKAGRPSIFLMRAVAQWSKRIDWTAHDKAFSEYVERAMQHPRRWSSGQGVGAVRAPWQWIAAVRLCGGDASKLDKAWDTPLLDATCYLTTSDVLAGDDSIVGYAEELAAEELRNAQPCNPK